MKNTLQPQTLVTIGRFLRSQFPPGDKIMAVFDWLQTLTPGYFGAQVSGNFISAYLALGNWDRLMPVAVALYGNGLALTMTRLEPGPPTRSGAAYTTEYMAVFLHGEWYSYTCDQAKRERTRNGGRSAPEGVLFGDFLEDFPKCPIRQPLSQERADWLYSNGTRDAAT